MNSKARSLASWLLLLTAPLAVACDDDDDDPMTPNDTGDITVSVTADGAASSGVTVELYAPGGTTAQETATTGANGTATFDDVEPGAHEVAVVVPEGFELVTDEPDRKPVTVTAGQTATVSFALVTEIAGVVVEVLATDDLVFSPANITIEPGTTVRWRSVSSMLHTVTPDGHTEWESATLANAGAVFVHTFDEVGVFDYFCEPHVAQGMVGTVTVEQ